VTLFTIGYQETTPDRVHDALKAAGVALLVDVRAVAASRRPGFSKRQLAAGVATIGVDYLHLRGLGTPADGRLAARSGRYDDMRRIFDAHLATPEADLEMEHVASLVASGQPLCLLCFERHAEHCHRRIIAERLQARLGIEVTDLLP
jgi:uncharacterized protein (DUF488 family)